MFRTKHFVCACARGDQVEGRLGITVAKKRVRRSVDRNRVKRVLREWYRLNRSNLTGNWDLVLIAQSQSQELGLAGITEELAPLIQWLNAKETPR